jgi:glycopeptide antibiotics resistance protein
VVLAGGLGLVLGLGAVWGLSSPRTRKKRMVEAGMILGTLPWLWMILTPKPAARAVDLVPLLPILAELRGDPGVAVEQIGGNLLVFAAFGFGARLRWNLAVWRIVALAAAGSLLVEVLQWVLDLGRVSSVNDVILNATGAGLAGLVGRGSVPAWIGRSR